MTIDAPRCTAHAPSVSFRPLTVHESVQLLRVCHSSHPLGQLLETAFAQFAEIGDVLQQPANVVDGDAGQLAKDVVRRQTEIGGLALHRCLHSRPLQLLSKKYHGNASFYVPHADREHHREDEKAVPDCYNQLRL